jgi:hypothetical protein
MNYAGRPHPPQTGKRGKCHLTFGSYCLLVGIGLLGFAAILWSSLSHPLQLQATGAVGCYPGRRSKGVDPRWIGRETARRRSAWD